MMIAKKGNKRVRLAFFYCCRRRRLNSVRQVNGDLPHPVVCAASAQFSTLSAQFSTLSAHFSTLSTHGRVWDILPSLRSPLLQSLGRSPCFRPGWREPGETCTRAPSESGNSRLTCRREVKSEALSLVERDIVYDDDHGFDFRLMRSGRYTVCCSRMDKSGTFDNSEEAKGRPGLPCSCHEEDVRQRNRQLSSNDHHILTNLTNLWQFMD